MRHKLAGYTLSRTSGQRTALRRTLVTQLVLNGRIQTTETKCKAIQNQAEKLISIAKKASPDKAGQVTARRLVAAQVNGGVETVRKVFELAPRFVDRKGGYTRISKLGPRKGDNAPMALIEWM